MGDVEDQAKREEARLMKTMARRQPSNSSGTSFSKASSVLVPNGPSTTTSTSSASSSTSRSGAPLPRSSSSTSPSSAVSSSSSLKVTTESSPTKNYGSGAYSAGTGKSQGSTAGPVSGQSGSTTPSNAPTGTMTKSPSFGSSRSIITRTASHNGASASAGSAKVSSVDEEAIRAREKAFDEERERLRKVELDLIRNGRNVLGDMGEIRSEAERQEEERARQRAAESRDNHESKTAPSHQTSTTPTSSSSSSQSSQLPLHTNKALIDDVDALLRQLNTAAAGLPASQTSQRENSELEEAKSILRARKSSITQSVSDAMAAPLPPDVDSELARYLRDIVAAMKVVQDMASLVPLSVDALPFRKFARHVDTLMLVVLRELHLILDHHSREVISNNVMETLEKAVQLMQDVEDQSGKSSGNLGSSVSATSPEDIILASQNKFVLFLKQLAQSITSAAKKQVEESQARRDSNTSLAQCVQETAQHAQSLAEVLKQSLFDPQAFKDRLSSLVTTIKKATSYMQQASQREHIMECTRKVLEASLALQQQNQTPNATPARGEDSPHIQIFKAIGELLRAILSTISN